jgi:hypothetical protein
VLFELIEENLSKRRATQHISVLLPLMIMLCLCAGLIAGCGGTVTQTTSAATGVTLHGSVLRGQQPVTGAMVYLYATGSTGYGSASTSLLNTSMSGVSTDGNGNGYVATDSSGNFNIIGDWSCANGTDQVYILALEGNPGLANGTNNSALALMAALGTCNSSISTYPSIVINEVTTVASVWVLRPFMTNATHIGASGTNTSGLSNAFAQVPNIVNIATGLALTKTPTARFRRARSIRSQIFLRRALTQRAEPLQPAAVSSPPQRPREKRRLPTPSQQRFTSRKTPATKSQRCSDCSQRVRHSSHS